jgi:PAS domain S-box-containing protein
MPSGGAQDLLMPLVHPEDRQRFHEMREAAFHNKPIPSWDFRIIRPDGEERIVHPEFRVVFDENGTPLRMFGTVQDITERKRIEIELRRSRENLARAQRIVGMGSFDRDLNSSKAEWSEEMYRILGIEKTDGVSSYDAFIGLTHPEDRARISAAITAEMKGTRAGALECRIIRPDGQERIVCRESDVVFDENGRPTRVFGTVQDITERKKAELELLRSRENLARAQRFAGMGSFERDLATAEGEWSDEMYRILGLENRDAVPEYGTLMNLIHPDDRTMFRASRAAEIKGKASQPLEYRIVRPDGVERIVRRESAVVFDDEKRPIRLHGTLQDITEQRLAERRERELERQLLHSQKLEALGTLAGGIAHDLNNTLVPVMALSKLTARRFEAGSLVRANLETIYEASERARDLVKRVVAFSRKDESEKRDTDIAEIVDEALKLLRVTIPSSITLEAQIAKVPPIPADASQIHQVVTNLVSNASQAIGSGIGTITVMLDLRSETPDRGEICLSVSDSGMGMDKATQQRIFEPFFTTKPVGQGTGLGLSIVHGIVAGHGGRIEVTSAPGKGTRFDLYFPVATAAAGVSSSRPAA